jgi:hypothetical protein
MYTIKAYWAGYLIIDGKAETNLSKEKFISDLKARFDDGIEWSVHRSTMKLEVLCIDIWDGVKMEMLDFK